MTTRAKTITLELLRDGPPHNQLISPLTAYLAACQNRPPEVVRFTIEHRDFLRWQAGLTYAGVSGPGGPGAGRAHVSMVERRHAIDDASKAVTSALGSIRALIGELASEPCVWRHIHLVVDASEVAALPFELARAPAGVMVEGDRLFLQQNARVTLTRQTRRIATSVVNWPTRPRVLCIVADGDLPADAHVLALRQHIDAWIGWDDAPVTMNETDENELIFDDAELMKRRGAEAKQILTVMDNPSLEQIAEMARATCFTHVHILAHGTPLPNASPGQPLYGLLFRGADGSPDVVDGDRLEAALRHPRGACSHPTAVTIMTCEGGSMTGGILGPGGSVAHAMHSKGVPFVVSSQFPLGKKASAIATDMLYRALLRGEDPRETVHAVRRELLVMYPDTHDWASLVAYGSFPPDLDEQLGAARRAYDRFAAETSIERLRVTLRLSTGSPHDPRTALGSRASSDVDRVDRDVARVRSLTDEEHPTAIRVRAYRMVARLALRMWDAYNEPSPPYTEPISELLGRASKHDSVTGQRPITALQPRELLKLSKDCYERAYLLDGSRWELWIQVVVLSWAWSPDWGELQWKEFVRDIHFARSVLEIQKLRTKQLTERGDERELAAGLTFEIELLAYLAVPPPLQQPSVPIVSSREDVERAFQEMVREVSPVSESYRAHCAYRQLRRYARWVSTTTHPGSVTMASRARVDAATVIADYVRKLRRERVRRNWGLRS